MAKPEKKQLSWSDVDMTTLKGAVAKAHEDYKTARAAARLKQEEFEAAFLADARKKKLVPDDKTIRFSYNFGRLGVAFDEEAPAKEKGGVFKL